MTASQMSGARRGRPRDPAAHQAILDAALEEYAERGWDGFTIDGVSRRSGFGKSTIYLRWSGKDSLLTESMSSRAANLEDVDTGTFGGDLETLATKLLRYYMDPLGWASLRLMVDSAALSGAPDHFDAAIVNPHLTAAGRLVERAAQRGEIPANPPTGTVVECLFGGVTMSALSIPADKRDLTDDQITERIRPIVDLILAAVCSPSVV